MKVYSGTQLMFETKGRVTLVTDEGEALVTRRETYRKPYTVETAERTRVCVSEEWDAEEAAHVLALVGE